MRYDERTKFSILRKLAASENVLTFETFSIHEIGGFKECDTPDWSSEEAYCIRLMVEEGLLNKTQTEGDEPWLEGHMPGGTISETYIGLTSLAHRKLGARTFRGRALTLGSLFGRSFALSAGQILLSVASAVLTVVALNYFGYSGSSNP